MSRKATASQTSARTYATHLAAFAFYIFKEERVRQKKLGNGVKQLGLKILINGGYGLFGSPAFKYADLVWLS
jgi:hypothetical protein